MIIFEQVLYCKEIRPENELAWTKWIIETENDYNLMFGIELERVLSPVSLQRPLYKAALIKEKWEAFVRYN